MNQIFIITPFPEMVEAIVSTSILNRAANKGLVKYHILDLRNYTRGKFKQMDDYPFGGGTGMVMMPEPIFEATDNVKSVYKGKGELRTIFPSPQGEPFTQEKAWELSECEGLIFICGHYKGIDERVRKYLVTDEISIGDYVLTNGELPTMMILDASVRLIPGVLGDHKSATTDSFSHKLLDHPHYTRPEELRGMKVPEILLSGHHAKIEAWRNEQREKRTQLRRPDLWEAYEKEISKIGENSHD